MDGATMAQYDQFQQGLGIFESFDEDMMGTGIHAQGGSRSSKASKKKNEDEDDINYTTIMLRNIPNKYTRQMLIDQLHRAGFRGSIDYMYLPTDFANRCNVGYCFVNFRDAAARARFQACFDGVAAQSCLPGFNSYKVCQVTRAKWQGREENVRRLKSGPELMAQLAAHPEWLPLLLDTEGNQEPFLCDEGVAAARSPAAPRRQMRKKGQGGGYMSPEEMAVAFPYGAGMDGMGMDATGMYGNDGRSRGRGGGGRGGRKPRYSDLAAAHATYAGVPTMMSVPVMTEQGLQYVPYDTYEGGYFLAYPSMEYGMQYNSGYGSGYPGSWWGSEGGFPDGFGTAAGVWPRGAAKAQRGRRKGAGGSGSGAPATAEGEEHEEDDEAEDDS